MAASNRREKAYPLGRTGACGGWTQHATRLSKVKASGWRLEVSRSSVMVPLRIRRARLSEFIGTFPFHGLSTMTGPVAAKREPRAVACSEA